MRHRVIMWSVVAIGMLVVASAQARPIPLVKAFAQRTSTNSFQVVGNGVYPPVSSQCYSQPGLRSLIRFTSGGQFLSAPIVVGVFWPGPQAPDPYVHALFPDFVTDLLNGPYWNAVMPQYVGAAHGVLGSSVDLPSLLTLAPSTTVHARYIATELVAQQRAGVLPAPDPNWNTIYVVHFPPGVTVTDESYTYTDFFGNLQTHVSIGTACVNYCAYHDSYLEPFEPRGFTFTVMPDFSQNAGCAASCGSGTPFDVYTEVLSHELLETVTDPFGLGWLNTCPAGAEEIADVCGSYNFRVPRRTLSPGTPQCPNRWAMSPVFSNAAWDLNNPNGCVVADATQLDCVLGVVPAPGLAATLELSAPSPNPAAQSTQLRYSLPFASFVRLSVMDVTGRMVAVLDRGIESPGAHSSAWDGRDAGGNRVPAGVYFVSLESAGQTQSRKIVLDR